jgi:fructose-bisphosphate aldolase class 1
MVELAGAIARETSVALVTETNVVPLIEPEVAVTVDMPAASAGTPRSGVLKLLG